MYNTGPPKYLISIPEQHKCVYGIHNNHDHIDEVAIPEVMQPTEHCIQMLMYIDILSSRVPLSPGTPYHQLYVKSTPLTNRWRSLMLLLQVLYHKSCYIQILQLFFVLPLVGVCCSGYKGPTLSLHIQDGRTKVVYAAAFTSFGLNYTLHHHILEVTKDGKYLGVTFSSDLSWNSHINNISDSHCNLEIIDVTTPGSLS
jgi:hypothetical protein